MSNIPIRDGNNDAKFLKATGEGSDLDPFIPQQNINQVNAGKPFNLQVAQREIAGYDPVDKFGYNPDIDTTSDPEDIWEGGGLYNFSAGADIVSVASDNAGDTQDLMVVGLDANGDEVEQTVTLNGTTRVALTTTLWRVFRMENEGNTDFAGTVFCYTGTGAVPSIGDSNVRAVILNGNNQTRMGIYTIPLGKVGFLLRGELGLGNNVSTGSGIVHYQSRRYQKVFKYKKTVPLNLNGQSVFQDVRSVPDIIPALTDIKINVSVVTDNDTSAMCAFDMYLVDEDLLDPALLAAIGQPSST